tara:strand:+ start:2577 stop:2909 length:333 start_codon:yes stop_codon:yes gene_type:complete
MDDVFFPDDDDKIPKIELGPQDQTEYLWQYIEELLETMDEIYCEIIDPEETESSYAGALVTDESALFDFTFSYTDKEEADFCKRLSEELGVEVNKQDYLVDIAKRMAHGG